jgi:hypothetical protein
MQTMSENDAFRFTAFDLGLFDFDKTLLSNAGSIWGLFWVVNGYFGQSCIRRDVHQSIHQVDVCILLL